MGAYSPNFERMRESKKREPRGLQTVVWHHYKTNHSQPPLCVPREDPHLPFQRFGETPLSAAEKANSKRVTPPVESFLRLN